MTKKLNIKKTRGPGLTLIEKMRLELFYAHQYNYHIMIRERTSAFDANGSVELTRTDGSTYIQDGHKWITDHIKYFEGEDNTPYYQMCAELVKVLDEYDAKFKRGHRF